MARKEIQITISAEGDDRGKVFLLRRMSAMKAEKWATRALLALARSGVDVPDDVASRGLAGIASYGVHALSGVQFAEAEPLLDEMMQCVEVVPDRNRPAFSRPLVEEDIDEVGTILLLRREILALHLGFLPPAVRSIFTGQTTGASEITSTSPSP